MLNLFAKIGYFWAYLRHLFPSLPPFWLYATSLPRTHYFRVLGQRGGKGALHLGGTICSKNHVASSHPRTSPVPGTLSPFLPNSDLLIFYFYRKYGWWMRNSPCCAVMCMKKCSCHHRLLKNKGNTYDESLYHCTNTSGSHIGPFQSPYLGSKTSHFYFRLVKKLYCREIPTA